MILAVDDQPEVLELVQKSLQREGHEVKTFEQPLAALTFLAENDVEMIISDINMPELDGFGFQKTYRERFPARRTPFVFLTSQSDPDTMVSGLNSGADDFLCKPIHGKVLCAKVKSLLNRLAPVPVGAVFHGDLGKFPLVKIMQFCESKGLTGTVEIPVGQKMARLRMVGGQIDLEGTPEESEILDQLYDLTEGTFHIYPEQIDFSSLADVAIDPPTAEEPPEAEKPMGKLSGVRLNQRLIQVQTEFVTRPENQILSVVILDGKVLLKRGNPTSAFEREELARLIEIQHTQVEEEIRTKAGELQERKGGKAAEEESNKERLSQLIDDGFEKYRSGDYAGALNDWEKAQKLDESNKTLSTNLTIVRRKLGQD